MARKKIDLTGKRFGRLVVLEKGKTTKVKNGTRIYWKCKCECGEIIEKRTDALTSGTTTRCGISCTVAKKRKWLASDMNVWLSLIFLESF